MKAFNPLDHPICFTDPLRIATTSWMEHVPFAMFLVDVLRPSVLVELGTFYGVSYCAFCQAVKATGAETRCYAVDTWKGDPHAGLLGPKALEDLRRHHDPLYGNFSQLVQSHFDEALQHFGDHSVDLLHIDGFHTYDAVKHDFESWLPKVSRRGVVLFHDINVHERDFGVWKLWESLKTEYLHLDFIHGHGLGVLAVGDEYPETFIRLLQSPEEELVVIREWFQQLGTRLEVIREIQSQKEIIKELRDTIHQNEHFIQRSWSLRLHRALLRHGLGGVIRKMKNKGSVEGATSRLDEQRARSLCGSLRRR